METPDAALTDRWGLLLATMVGNGAGLAALPFFALSSFMVPLKAAFGWPRGNVGLAATILAGGVFLTAAMTGRLCDRFGARVVAIWSVGLYAMDLATMAADGPRIGWFYGQFALLALVGGGTTSVAYSRMIAASFRRRRGLALGIMASGGGVTALLLPMLLNRVIEDHGWRAGWLVCAGIALLPLPLLLALRRECAAASVSALDRLPGLSMGEALRTRAFWLLGAAIALSISAASGLVVHLKPMLLDLGLAPLTAARIAGLLGLGILVGRLGTGYLLDRIDGSKLAACVMAGGHARVCAAGGAARQHRLRGRLAGGMHDRRGGRSAGLPHREPLRPAQLRRDLRLAVRRDVAWLGHGAGPGGAAVSYGRRLWAGALAVRGAEHAGGACLPASALDWFAEPPPWTHCRSSLAYCMRQLETAARSGGSLKTLGITGFGAYIPTLRIARTIMADTHRWMAPSLRGQAKGSRSFCGWDEDAITMAVEAGRDGLAGAAGPPAMLLLASTTMPYADLQNSVIVAEALGLPASTGTMDVAHSQRSGTSALLMALRGAEEALVIASDKPVGKPASVQELSYGAGAAAIRVGKDGVVARLLGTATISRGMVDHFRAAGAMYDYVWEERWLRDVGYSRIVPEAVQGALASAGLAIGDIAHFVMPAAQRNAAEAVARALGFAGRVAPGLEDGCGYAGAAHSLLMLAATLEDARPGERILLVGFGQGADALVLEMTDAMTDCAGRRGVAGSLAHGMATESYLRLLSFAGGIDLEWGMRSEKSGKTALTEQYRSAEQIASFTAGRCSACGTIQFPQLEYCVNQSCLAPAAQFTPVRLADEKFQVLTYTADWLSYHPAPPLYVGFVQFHNGARLLMEVVDVGPDGLDVGTPLRAVFRIKEQDKQRGFNRYFWKATPVVA